MQGKTNRGRHTDHLAWRHSIQTKQCPPPSSPMFFTGRMTFLPSNPTVSKHWRQLAHSDYAEDATVLLNGVTCKAESISQGQRQSCMLKKLLYLQNDARQRCCYHRPQIESNILPSEYSHFQWLCMTFKVFHLLKAFQVQFLVQLCSSWHRSPQGTSATAKPLVLLIGSTVNFLLSVKSKEHFAQFPAYYKFNKHGMDLIIAADISIKSSWKYTVSQKNLPTFDLL